MIKHAAIQSFLLRAAFAALGLWLATRMLSGLSFPDVQTLIIAALLLGVMNAVVRPASDCIDAAHYCHHDGFVSISCECRQCWDWSLPCWKVFIFAVSVLR